MSAFNFSRSLMGISEAGLTDGPPKNRQRRNRTYFSDEALDRLETVFKDNPYPDVLQRESLGEEVSVSEARIQVWFQNRRSRSRRNKTKKTPKSSPSLSADSSTSSLSLSSSSSSSSTSPSPGKTTPLKAKLIPNTHKPVSPMLSPYPYSYMHSSMFMPSMYPVMPLHHISTAHIPSSPYWSPSATQPINRYFDFQVPISPSQVSPLYIGRYGLPVTPETSPSATDASAPTYLPYTPLAFNTMTSSAPPSMLPAEATEHNEEDIDVVTP